jgi:hypothetical protein
MAVDNKPLAANFAFSVYKSGNSGVAIVINRVHIDKSRINASSV